LKKGRKKGGRRDHVGKSNERLNRDRLKKAEGILICARKQKLFYFLLYKKLYEDFRPKVWVGNFLWETEGLGLAVGTIEWGVAAVAKTVRETGFLVRATPTRNSRRTCSKPLLYRDSSNTTSGPHGQHQLNIIGQP
jgi:hypothetical protein